MIIYRKAKLSDVAEIARLEQVHINDELTGESPVHGQLSGQGFDNKALTELVNRHYLVVAEANGAIVGYVMAAAWSFFTPLPIYGAIVKRLAMLDYDGPKLTVANSCQYGPIWISPEYRGKGVFSPLVAKLKADVGNQFLNMVTFIAEDNSRSFAAHSNKAKMQVVDFFSFQGRDYYLLHTAC
jgi:hypothetical protein